MRRVVIWNLMSLDGYFEGQTPWDLGFHEAVWGEELEAFSLAQGEEIGTLLFGRRTYEGMADYWSAETGPVADMMNSIDKRVVSRTLTQATWNNSTLLSGPLEEAVASLKAEPGKDIYVFGSADLTAQLLDLGVVDEYRLCLAPIALGAGNPLFKPGSRHAFALADARTLQTGGIILRYRPA